ncbi:MAG TPA: GGDEF domain-containing protein [Candidatus Dormibacteraeota bacterium]|nr:GGDEF domain-containing protein [Candidatus Dormibacteraeota bacterium]
MAVRLEPLDETGPHPGLGLALGRRAEDCARVAATRIDGFGWTGQPPSDTYLDSRFRHMWFGTLLVARWLVTGEVANSDELDWISRSGRSAALEGLSVVNIARAYLVWRDVVIEALVEEAAITGASDAALDVAIRVVRATCDGNLMRMTRTFDAHLKEIAAELEDERRHLREATLHDQLTGLANRILLYDRIGHAVAQSRRGRQSLAVLLIDLDGFKEINDSLGHGYGDRVLVELAGRLNATVRGSDTVARLGGDEFVLVLPDTTRSRALAIAGKVLRVLTQPLCIDGAQRSLWASIGVAVFPEDGDDVDALLLAADHAMYTAKRAGGGVHAAAPAA